MTSKVLVKMPAVPPFAQVNNVKKSNPGEPFTPVAGSSSALGAPAGLDSALRVAQLEQNIRFLQEQHALLLTGLHREIDVQRQMNRDLQFQLVFSKRKTNDTAEESTTPKSEEPHTPPTTVTQPSPVSEDTPKENPDKERCAKLEQELTAAKAALQTSLARTAELQTQLQQYKREAQEASSQAAGVASWGAGGTGAEAGDERALRGRLAEAERLVGGLRAQGERQRREVLRGERGVTNLLFEAPVATNYLQSIKASLNAAGRGNAGGGGGGRGAQRGGQRFPPLQPPQHQAYWQQREPQKEKVESQLERPTKMCLSKSNLIAFGRTLAKTSPKPSPRNNVAIKTVIPNKEIKQNVVSSSLLPKTQNISSQIQSKTLKLSSPSVPSVSMGKCDRQK